MGDVPAVGGMLPQALWVLPHYGGRRRAHHDEDAVSRSVAAFKAASSSVKET